MLDFHKEKVICYTLDLEKDYGRLDSYDACRLVDELIDLFKAKNLKLTIFATGEIIEKKSDVIKRFQESLDCEFNLHSYSHSVDNRIMADERINDMLAAKSAYANFFKITPIGYRAPQGVVTPLELGALAREGFLYDSSIIPSWRPGLFNNLSVSDRPFKDSRSGLVRIPISSVGNIKIPLSLSYLQFFGWSLSRRFIKFNRSPLVFNFHLHNLDKLPGINNLERTQKVFYWHNQKKGMGILKKFIELNEKNNYKSVLMKDIYENIIN